MEVFIVVWTLSYERTNYSEALSAFVNRLQTYRNVWDQGFESVIFIQSNQSAAEIFDFLCDGLEGGDSLLVSKLNDDEYSGRLAQSTRDWIGSPRIRPIKQLS